MKRFQFALEKLLRLREQAVEEAKRAFAIALQQAQAKRDALADREQALDEAAWRLVRHQSAGLSAADFAAWRRYVRHLNALREGAAQSLAVAETHAEHLRFQMLTSQREHKALERLRELRYEEYTAEMLRQEQSELDEFGARAGLNREAVVIEI